MRTLDLLALQSYAGDAGPAAPERQRCAVAHAITEVSGAGGHIIRRPRLTRLLDEAETPLLLLVAPAGYGKTTLAREWVAAQGRKSVWFRAGESCTDPAALAQELANVLESVRPGVARRVADHLKVADAPDVDILSELLTDSDALWPSRAWFVVDDYHAVMRSPDAERLLENVCRSAERVLIATRERPTWVDARFLLYGEAFELGQSALAMTHEEAEGVFANAERKPAGLVALANGWPAVIGLAALLPEGVTPTADVPGELHEFFAQELYKTLDVPTRRALVLLSLPNTIDSELIARVLESDAPAFLARAGARGFLASSPGGPLEIHPLVRTFLLSKFSEERGALTTALERLLHCLFQRRQWDDAFTVIERTHIRNDARRLLSEAAPELLNAGRLTTVESWLTWANDHGVEGPELTLVRAELLLRQGELAAAESLASASASALRPGFPAAQAYICAGSAAHLQEKAHVAQAYFHEALEVDQSLPVKS